MARRAKLYLKDMLLAAETVSELTSEVSFETYVSDRILRAAVERNLITLGEALYQLAAGYPKVAMQIPDYRGLIDFRHVLVHGYHRTRHLTVWGLIQTRLPEVQEVLRHLVDESSDLD